jgi:hypothetical protein
MTVQVLPPAWAQRAQSAGIPVADVTSRGTGFRPLSPMLLGPVMLYAGQWSRTVENAWQYSKVYPQHVQAGGLAGSQWWDWARAGWDNPRAVRYPMGRGAKPLYSLWNGEQLDYVTARRRIYIPLYVQAVRFYQWVEIRILRNAAAKGDIAILDFDAYDHRALGYSWDDVINDEKRKMGHGFVLAMMIEGVL